MNHKIDYSKLVELLKDSPEYLPYQLEFSNDFDTFLKIRETLTRIGRYQKEKGKESIWQVCQIVQDEKTMNHYLVHFKHLYMLFGDGKTEFLEQDYNQMTYIASLLKKWKMTEFTEEFDVPEGRFNITIIPYNRKKEVQLFKKFFIKNKKEKVAV